jgi:hypothetical protein
MQTQPVDIQTRQSQSSRIPLWLKLLYTVFVCVLVPTYWTAYGPRNFLYFCDVALLVTLPAIWLESGLLVSMQAVAILLPQALWVVDFVSQLVFGRGPVGLTAYMFNPNLWWFARGLSLFHGWLPFLLVYLAWRLGYDRRAFVLQSICGIALLLVCYFFIPAAANINYVFGLSDKEPQQWMAPELWLAMLVAAFPTILYLPVHLVLSRCFGRSREVEPAPATV